ncbi:MAG: DUF808 family protein [Myxococcota bacterium]
MPTSGLLALLDDVIAIMDDVATVSKLAAEKTVGIAGDDLAVNAEGLVGLHPSRELPILGKVALGSLANKVVLVPLALALPGAAIQPLLMFGGAFLCYEGVHKVLHKVLPHDDAHDEAHGEAVVRAVRSDDPAELARVEQGKVRQALLTDIVLSAEIVAVALGAIGDVELKVKAVALSAVAVAMTIGIYGIVAVLVKIDDYGLWLERRGGAAATVGRFLVRAMPTVMRTLSVVGTLAMFLVGGGILAHGLGIHLDHLVHDLHLPGALEWLVGFLAPGVVGFVLGLVVVAVVEAGKAVYRRVKPA